MAASPIRSKSYSFALKIIKLSRHLQFEIKEYILSRQLLRAGTSIGANVEEASAGLTRKDFVAKLAVASKEARETRYWLRLLRDSNYIERDVAKSMLDDCNELVRLLTASIKTIQQAPNSASTLNQAQN